MVRHVETRGVVRTAGTLAPQGWDTKKAMSTHAGEVDDFTRNVMSEMSFKREFVKRKKRRAQ